MKWLVWSVVLAACDDPDSCPAPPALLYECAPVAPSANACAGGAPDEDGHPYDTQQSYPLGCHVTLPYCGRADPNAAQTCDCTAGTNGAAPFWGCPL